MANAFQQVESVFNNAQSYVGTYKAYAATYLSNLSAVAQSLPKEPTLPSVPASPAPPSVMTLPSAPTLSAIDPIDPNSSKPAALSLPDPTIDVPSDNVSVPTPVFESRPEISFGLAPTVPSVEAIMVPGAPEVAAPPAPTLLTIATPTFAGVDLHEGWLAQLDGIPNLELVSPSPYTYARGPEYASALLDALKSRLAQRLQGGTGLPAAVEQAIWDRARDRETAVAQANVDEVQRQSEALGFQLPPGILSAQMREAQQKYYDKLSELSRDVAIKQAELEQENMKQSIAVTMDLEKQLIDYSWKLEQMSFESAKTLAENSIAMYNAEVEGYKAKLSSYNLLIEAYKALIQLELSKVEVYKAEIQAEETKAQINNTLVQQYKAMIEANMAKVEIYRAEVGGAQAKMQLEQTKIAAVGEQIKAYVAQINGETAKIEAYKAGVQAEVAKTEVYKVKADVFKTKADVQLQKAQAEIAKYQALYQAKAQEWEGYKAYMQAETARVNSGVAIQNMEVSAFQAEASAETAKYQAEAAKYGADIKLYEASATFSMQSANIANTWATTTYGLKSDATKTGAQIYAQLLASAMSIQNATASIQGSTSGTINYSYSNDTTSAGPAKTTVMEL